MKTTKAHTLRWAVAVLAVVAVAGISGGAIAKEKKAKTEAPGTESGNGNGYIGVYLQELTSDVRKGLDIDVTKGVLVSGVENDAPAELAGIEEGDVIVKFNGRSVDSADGLREAVRDVAPGKEARVELVRDGKEKTITVTVGERPEEHSFIWKSDGDEDMPMHFGRGMAMFGGPRLGIQAHELEDDGLASYFGAKKGEGILVLSVDDESVAGKAGVKPGDIISKVGNESIEDSGDVRSALDDYKEGDTFDITVLRHGKTQALKATMDDQSHEFAFTVPDPMIRMHTPRTPRAPRAPMMMHGDRDDLRRELDDLKKEIRELKEELDARDDG
ncbi:MAG TPA: PDZ domain-containing protein [Candidatus Krumholzibacteria bacterium]